MSIKSISKRLALAGVQHVVVAAPKFTTKWLHDGSNTEALTANLQDTASASLIDLEPLPYELVKPLTSVVPQGYRALFVVGKSNGKNKVSVKMEYIHDEDRTEVSIFCNGKARKYIQHGSYWSHASEFGESLGQRALKSQFKSVISHLRDNYSKELLAASKEAKL